MNGEPKTDQICELFFLIPGTDGKAAARIPVGNQRLEESRLFAAAPDLLEACKMALARIESDIETPQSHSREGDYLRAAIAKAG